MTIRTLFAATESSDRGSWLRHLVFPGVMGLTIAIVLQFFKLLNMQPKEALGLLSNWGPNFILGILIVAIIGGLLSEVVNISRDGVAAQRQMAEAVAKIAEKDDRQIAEIQLLSSFSAQQSERMFDRLKEMHRSVERIEKWIDARERGEDARGIAS